MARELARQTEGAQEPDDSEYCNLDAGRVKFVELDAEKMGQFFNTPPNKASFDVVWISEAMSHLPRKELFFQSAFSLLSDGGKLVVADWFKGEDLTDQEEKADIRPIEGKTAFTREYLVKLLSS
jgi:tocopherol O-methyltransferase